MATRPFRYVSVDKQALAEEEAAAYRWSVTSIGELRGAACTETSDREAASQGGSFASCAQQNFHLVSSTMLNLHWRRRPPGDDWAFRGTYQRVPHTAIMDPPTAERTLWLLWVASTHTAEVFTVDFSGRIFLSIQGNARAVCRV